MAILRTTPGGAPEGANTEITASRAAITSAVRAKPLALKRASKAPAAPEQFRVSSDLALIPRGSRAGTAGPRR